MSAPSVLLLRTDPPAPGGVDVDPAHLSERAALAWYWPEGREVVGGVRSAIRVEGPPAPTPLDAALLLTAKAAELARAPGTLAVLWEPTGLIHEAAAFVDQATDAGREDLPLYLWVRFEGTKGEDGTLGMRTHGLGALGAMEVEVEGSKRDGEHVLECVTDVALFLATGGVPPEDGETIEVTRGPLRVRRMPSLGGDGTTALRVRV